MYSCIYIYIYSGSSVEVSYVSWVFLLFERSLSLFYVSYIEWLDLFNMKQHTNDGVVFVSVSFVSVCLCLYLFRRYI